MMKKLVIVTSFVLLLACTHSLSFGIQASNNKVTDIEIQEIVEAFHDPNREVRAGAFGKLLRYSDEGFVLRERYDCEPIRKALVELLARERASGQPFHGESGAEYISALVTVLSELRDPRALSDILYYRHGLLRTYDYLAEVGGREIMQMAMKELKDRESEVEDGLRLLRRMIGNKNASYTPTEKEKCEIANLMEEVIHRFPHPEKGEPDYEVKAGNYWARKACVEIIGKLEDTSRIPLIQSLATSDKYWTFVHKVGDKVYPVIDPRAIARLKDELWQVYPVREEAEKVLKQLEAKKKAIEEGKNQ